MKIFDKTLVLAIVLILSHTEEDDDKYRKTVTAVNYHTKIGIPKAAILSIAKTFSNSKLNIIYEIVGGQVVDVKDVPYQVSTQDFSDKRFFWSYYMFEKWHDLDTHIIFVGLIITLKVLLKSICGGSLISSSRVLTAGHCYYDGTFTAKSYEVVLGSSKLYEGGERIHTEDFAVHPDWNPATVTNDLSILRIPPVTFTLLIQPIALPRGEVLSNEFAGWTALASGYGITGDDKHIAISQQLSSVNLTIISNADCATVFHDLIQYSIICTRGIHHGTTCQGDSGGPLVVTIKGKPILVGATSFGVEGGCEKGFPAAYSRISSFVDWIVEQ